MIKIVNFYAQSIGARDVFICFSVTEIADPIERYSFDLYRASDYSTWRKIASLDGVTYYFDEVSMPTSNWSLQYKIDVVDKYNKEPIQHVSYIELNSNNNDLIGRDLARKYRLVLSKKNGSKANYFMTIKGGLRCPQCSNETLGVPTSSNCPVCHGTGYTKGFHSPIPTFVQFTNRTKKFDLSVPISDTNPGSLIMANYPLAYPQDIIHEFSRNRFWEVVTVNCLEHNGYVYGQQVMAAQIPHSQDVVSAIKSYETEADIVDQSRRYSGKKTL